MSGGGFDAKDRGTKNVVTPVVVHLLGDSSQKFEQMLFVICGTQCVAELNGFVSRQISAAGADGSKVFEVNTLYTLVKVGIIVIPDSDDALLKSASKPGAQIRVFFRQGNDKWSVGQTSVRKFAARA